MLRCPGSQQQKQSPFSMHFFCSSAVSFVKTRIGLLAETLETRSSLGRGTWPQLMCCALVAVRVPEVGRGWVGASEQGGSLDDDQDK